MSATARGRRPERALRARPWWLLYVAVIVFAAMAAYVLWLDEQARRAFADARWEAPARVYARPLELYAGRALLRDDVESELRLLGYREAAVLRSSGEFVRSGDGLLLATRGFGFRDAPEPPRHLMLAFSGSTLTGIAPVPDTDGPVPSVVRLEPLEVARIVPHGREDRVLLRRTDLPQALVQALLAAEDRRFYQHSGIDLLALGRALLVNVRAGRVRQGGSTLTQQLAKNLFLGRERTYARKANEALLALLLERRHPKDALLEAYCNEIFLGQDGDRAIHGFGLGAQFYFGRPLGELPVEQVALLVGLVRGPTYYDPRRHPERARRRRDEVLAAMAAQGYVGPSELAQARGAPLGIDVRGSAATRFPAFMQAVRANLADAYQDDDLRVADLRIFTTLDPLVQLAAERAVADRLVALESAPNRTRRNLQAAVIVTESTTGELLAIVGGRDGRYAGFNRALDARRPVGSLAKPAVYLAALRARGRYTVATMLDDASVALRDGSGKLWQPRNYDGRVHGRLPLAEAFARSLNLATVRLGLDVGHDAVLAAFRDLGVERALGRYPANFLGAFELSPIEVARMYQTIANGGFAARLRSVREVARADGGELQGYALDLRPTITPPDAFLLQFLLGRVTTAGTAAAAGRALAGVRPLGGKTGTTNDLRDSWFAGYAGRLLAVVWVGRDDNGPAGLTGATGALPIWIDLMRSARPAAVDTVVPPGIAWMSIDLETGTAAVPGCPGAIAMPFIDGTQPPEVRSCPIR